MSQNNEVTVLLIYTDTKGYLNANLKMEIRQRIATVGRLRVIVRRISIRRPKITFSLFLGRP